MKYLAVFLLVFAILALCFHPQINKHYDTRFFLVCMGYAYVILISFPPSMVAFQDGRKKAETAAGFAIFIFFVTIRLLEMYKLIKFR